MSAQSTVSVPTWTQATRDARRYGEIRQIIRMMSLRFVRRHRLNRTKKLANRARNIWLMVL